MAAVHSVTDAHEFEDYQAIIDNWSPHGLLCFRIMPDKSLAGVHTFMFTFGIVTQIEFSSMGPRWCFEHPAEALVALGMWDGFNDPPGPWLKRKGVGHPEGHNPNMYRQHKTMPYIWDRIPKDELDLAAIWPRGL